MPRPTIGFIGLGAMGEPMAARLLDAGFRVVSSINRTSLPSLSSVENTKRYGRMGRESSGCVNGPSPRCFSPVPVYHAVEGRGRSPAVRKALDAYDFTLTPTLSLKGEGELRSPAQAASR